VGAGTPDCSATLNHNEAFCRFWRQEERTKTSVFKFKDTNGSDRNPVSTLQPASVDVRGFPTSPLEFDIKLRSRHHSPGGQTRDDATYYFA
jgi:hypothetical protein